MISNNARLLFVALQAGAVLEVRNESGKYVESSLNGHDYHIHSVEELMDSNSPYRAKIEVYNSRADMSRLYALADDGVKLEKMDANTFIWEEAAINDDADSCLLRRSIYRKMKKTVEDLFEEFFAGSADKRGKDASLALFKKGYELGRKDNES